MTRVLSKSFFLRWTAASRTGLPTRSPRPPPSVANTTRNTLQRASLVSQSSPVCSSSPFDPNSTSSPPSAATKKKHAFIPRKPAVQMTDKARKFFKLLLESPPRPEIIGIMLNYGQSRSGEPRMVFSFEFVTAKDVVSADERVSLGLIEEKDRDGNTVLVPKSPADCLDDGLPKLYVHHNAFLKVLGATVDVDTKTITPILHDREGNRMDPNF